MKALVTGGGGFVGRHLLRELAASGYEIGATVLEGEQASRGGEIPGVRWFQMDLGSQASVDSAVQVWPADVIFHLAGQASVGASFEDPMSTWDTNSTGVLRLFRGLRAANQSPRLVLVSSAEVYGDQASDSHPTSESTHPAPVSPYGASKVAAEVIARTLGSNAGIDVVISRSFPHIGPGQDERFVLPSIASQLVAIKNGNREPTVHVGNLSVERDFLDVRDVVRAYVCLAEAGEAGNTYNVCSGTSRSLESVVRRLIELSATGAQLVVDKQRVRSVDIEKLWGDPSRIRALGWTQRWELDQTLQDLLAEAEERA